MFHSEIQAETECKGELAWDGSSGNRACLGCGKRFSNQVVNEVLEAQAEEVEEEEKD